MPPPPTRHLKFAEPVTIHVTVREPALDTAGKPIMRDGEPVFVAVERTKTITRGEAICDAIRRGCTHSGAAQAYGVAKWDIQHYLQQGREDLQADPPLDTPRAAFARAVAEAEGQSEQALVEVLRYIAMQRDDMNVAARTATWLLEHRFPETWGARSQVDVTSGGRPLDAVDPAVRRAAVLAAADRIRAAADGTDTDG